MNSEEEEALFFSSPVSFSHRTSKEILAYAVGAALYMPATRPHIADDIMNGKHEGLTTIIIDLEDAVGDEQVEFAEQCLAQHLMLVAEYMESGMLTSNRLPLLFVRVRSPEQLERLFDILGERMSLLTGIALPKFDCANGRAYLQLIHEYNQQKPNSHPLLYAMPILETAEVIYRETRWDTLLQLKQIVDEYAPYVLNIRIGATDFSSLFGLRRSPEFTIYDIATIRDCISDIINLYGREENGYVISGPVWEYFSQRERVFKPQLRQTPFEETLGKTGRNLRMKYITNSMDGMMREVMMDKENGIIGKTIIHPTHIKPVQAMYVVTHEEFVDAQGIVARNDGSLGVFKSAYTNKMNEIKPHLSWAKRILIRSQIYGVLHEQQHFVGLLPKHEHTYVSYS
ncbi:HpcH/HpaI aldolase/citrate lyase family protein [Paenibacillus sp. LS1]|uniref:HpcH/HpaI aldolase/citrate lyase family protein n=1 Tax=Paenibacillus sp. LS1 TaxID=2992120 RepID=UPI00222FC1A6|nr:HpcH/HpaI aldolase/citrate lyase family protein [Paenibacillus sp. LS1]MCW3795294.1 HpcH/HpaI aldolase/citrate lyase family protein [Paenibacillus sp. LS1]